MNVDNNTRGISLRYPSVQYDRSLEAEVIESGKLDLLKHHFVYSGNVAVASRLWGLEFVATRSVINVIDHSSTPAILVGTITFGRDRDAARTPCKGATFLRIGTLLGREVLGVVDDDANVFVWRTLQIYEAVRNRRKEQISLNVRPWFNTKVSDSCWGLAFHPTRPLMATSDNSQTISLFQMERSSETLVVVRKIDQTGLGGNIPSIEFLKIDEPLLVDETEVRGKCDDAILISFTTLELDLYTGRQGVWQLSWNRLNDTVGTIGYPGNTRWMSIPAQYTGKIRWAKTLHQGGWTTHGINRRHFMKVFSVLDLAGSDTSLPKLSNTTHSVVYAADACRASSLLKRTIVRRMMAPLASLISEPQWLRDQVRQAEERAKDIHDMNRTEMQRFLDNTYIFSTTETQGFIIRASDGYARAAILDGLIPPYAGKAPVSMSIVQIIEPLSLAIVVSRSAVVTFLRFTEDEGTLGIRQEFVAQVESEGETHDPVIVGVSVIPVRTQDFEYDLQVLAQQGQDEAIRCFDVEDPSIGLTNEFIVRLHMLDHHVHTITLKA